MSLPILQQMRLEHRGRPNTNTSTYKNIEIHKFKYKNTNSYRESSEGDLNIGVDQVSSLSAKSMLQVGHHRGVHPSGIGKYFHKTWAKTNTKTSQSITEEFILVALHIIRE